MRVDVYLSKVCVLKSRSLAKEACERGKVKLNGETAKGSRLVHDGDTITLDLGLRFVELEVLEVPLGQVARRDVGEYVRVIRDEWSEPEF